MVSQIHFHPSDLTPPPAAFLALVAEVLTAHDAIWESQEHGELRLSDGTEIGLFTDEEENVAVFVLETRTEAAFDLIYDLAEATHSFVLLKAFAIRTPATGEVLPALAMSFPSANLAPDRQTFISWMLDDGEDEEEGETLPPPNDAELEAAALAAAPPREQPTLVSRPKKPLLQRLSDALFGKSI